MRAEVSEDSDNDSMHMHGGPWIRTIGTGDGTTWSSTHISTRLRGLSDISDDEPYSLNTVDQEETVDIDVSSPTHSIE